MMKPLSFAAMATMLWAATAHADGTITVVSFGGAYQDAERKAMYAPTAQKLGLTLREDSLRGIADVRLQVQSGKPTWDIVELGKQYCMSDEGKTLFEPLDFSLIPNAKQLDPRLVGENWVGGPVTYSYVIAWNKEKYGANPPRNWVDFFDTKKFPGGRALFAQPRFMLEIALLGDGVPRDKIYPIDVDRALAKLKAAKPDIQVFYASHGQSVQLAKDGEVDIMAILDGRVDAAIKDGAKFDFTYNDGVMDAGCLAIPKGAPNKRDAMRAINEFISADFQANIPAAFAYGPINPKAFETGKIPPQVAEKLNSSPKNASAQLLLDSAWWATHERDVQPRWDALLQ